MHTSSHPHRPSGPAIGRRSSQAWARDTPSHFKTTSLRGLSDGESARSAAWMGAITPIHDRVRGCGTARHGDAGGGGRWRGARAGCAERADTRRSGTHSRPNVKHWRFDSSTAGGTSSPSGHRRSRSTASPAGHAMSGRARGAAHTAPRQHQPRTARTTGARTHTHTRHAAALRELGCCPHTCLGCGVAASVPPLRRRHQHRHRGRGTGRVRDPFSIRHGPL